MAFHPFLSIDERMPISLLEIHQRLISDGIVSSEASANATLVYAVKWMEGFPLDFAKSAVKVNRARLRKLGIDIAKPYGGQISPSSQRC
ncbi:hypothetical protein BVH03_15305 [Pseudomonas sp. PA15(2017)]|nr:hypothetical protein BVH03_15305 [Pseudomonas sp. PA15(2017)]